MMRTVVLLTMLLVAASPVTAVMVEFNEGQHTGDNQVAGQLAGAEITAAGEHPFNSITMEATELVVREARTDYYAEMDDGPHHAWDPVHNDLQLHNVVVDAIARDSTMYAAIHPIDGATITYQSEASTSRPSTDDTLADFNWIQMAEPRESDVSDTLDVASKDHVDATVTGGISVNLWGWNVRITSDEGVYEYQTGPSHDTEAGPASVGPATQLQIESINATATFSGTFDEVHHVWIRDAVAESDLMDLKLTDEDLPTDQEVFVERSRMKVLGVTEELVVADIIPVPLPTDEASESDPSNINATGQENATDAAGPLLGIDGGGAAPLTTLDRPDTGLPGWAVAGIIVASLVAVFFVVRQTKGWPVHSVFVRRCESLHDQERYFLVSVLSTIGHWLRPQETRHRFHRGLARMEHEYWNGARRDLVWAARHDSDPGGRAVSAYYAARAAAHGDRPAIAGDMLAAAARINEQFLWDAQNDRTLKGLSGNPEFEARLASGLS